MLKYNKNDEIELELDISFDEDWETEEELNNLAKKYGYKLIKIYELHGPAGGAAFVKARSTVENFLKNYFIYEKDGDLYETATDEKI